MKARGGKREIKNNLHKKGKNNNVEATIKTKDEINSLNWRLDRKNISEYDLDRILAYS